jgi:glycosyltransferase involved in cell wall biosynthesis
MHNDDFGLDFDYSTIRLLSRVKPVIEKKPGDKSEMLLFLPKGNDRNGEGGLRTKGVFKHSYKNTNGGWHIYGFADQPIPVDEETTQKIEENIVKLGDVADEINELPLISIITVVFNGEKYLEETIRSVLNQTYPNVEYIIIDGGSTDGTLSIINKYEDSIDYWVSEKDTGMYDALKKGFSLATGSIFAWLNSDDIYFNYSLKQVASFFTKYKIKWLTGIPTVINERGEIIRVFNARYYFKYFIQRGYYRSGIMGFIQQESSFFSRDLFAKVGGLDTSFKLAGDYDLWVKFARFEKLYCIKTILASFRKHKNQMSNNAIAYLNECNRVRKPRLKIISLILLPLDILFSPIKCIKPE